MLILPASLVLFGCAEATGIRTTIHQGSDSSVYLQWVPNESFQASHPAVLSPIILRHALLGVHVQDPTGIFDGFGDKTPQASRMFVDEAVTFLVPHLASALSQATPEEHVVFNWRSSVDADHRAIEGTLSIHNDLLVLTLTHYGNIPAGTIEGYRGNRRVPDSSGLDGRKISFAPVPAWRQGVVRISGRPGKLSPRTLVLQIGVLTDVAQESRGQDIVHSKDVERQGSGGRPSPPTPRVPKDKELETLEEKLRILKGEVSQVEKNIQERKNNQ